MAPIIVKPENAIKRADELVNVGQSMSALQILHEAMISKKYRAYSDAHELLMMRLVELAVSLRKGKHAREALHAFKNLSQNISVQALENVIKYFIDLIDAKVAQVQEKADKALIDQIEDLDESETPESIMLSTLGVKDQKSEAIAPWLKFLWETYRSLLDVLKYNSKLEPLYQNSAHKAFNFCLKYNRKTEMRRLCELLRTHLQSISKYAHQQNSINLNTPESMQMHLDTRFLQLNAATKLELWQEAFRSVEDIHGLVSMTKKAPKPIMTINFFEQLLKIFLVADNYLFHAASWNKFYVASMAQGDVSVHDEQRMATMVLLSALTVPLANGKKIDIYESDNERFRSQALIRYLNLSHVPTRLELIKDAISRNLLSKVHPEVRELYEILEIKFHPLEIIKKMNPLILTLGQDADMAKYIRPLYNVVLTRLLQQLSQVYTTINLDFLYGLASLPEPYTLSSFEFERFILLKCKNGELSIRLDHMENTLTFDNALMDYRYVQSSQCQNLISEKFRTQLSQLGYTCEEVTNIDKKSIVVENIEEIIAQERAEAVSRRGRIERRKEIMESVIQKKEMEEARIRTLRVQQEAEAERARLAEESKKREMERLRREREEIERGQALKLAEEMKKKNLKIDMEDLENMDRSRLLQLQVEQIEASKKELAAKLKSLSRRIDHTERAYRIEEIPLIKESYEVQKIQDRESYERAHTLLVDATKRQHAADLEAKIRLERLKNEYYAFKKTVLDKREKEYMKLKEEAQKNIEAAKLQRIEELKEKKRQELIKAKLAEAKQKQEEEDRIKMEEEEARKEKERSAKEAGKYKVPILRGSTSQSNITESRFAALATEPASTPTSSNVWRPSKPLTERSTESKFTPSAVSRADSTPEARSWRSNKLPTERSSESKNTPSVASRVDSTSDAPKIYVAPQFRKK